ncbi:MAG: M15 family metallopeptidase [Deltaproteobacteria bacterium]|nr:M15 family metallopeptidase [Deltaproteobacteria bacterium]
MKAGSEHSSVALFCGAALATPGALAQPFHGAAGPLDAATLAVMTAPGGSWRAGCPVGLGDLWLLQVDHWGFDGAVHPGRLVVHRGHAGRLVEVFRALFQARFPIERMELVDTYGADDHRSMEANNTSAFNCREVAGRPGVWSQHAFGLALDLNPVQNPYLATGVVSPPAGLAWLDRTRPAPGLITAEGVVVRAFARAGWRWGGFWRHSKDYQHFSANGR